MLEIIKIYSSQERMKILSTFDANKETLIVSDLRSKFEMQSELIKKQGYFEDFSVLRASELWRLILRRNSPDMRLVSKDFIRTWLREKLANSSLAVARHRGEETLLEFLELMIQVITHPMGQEQMKDWLEVNPTSAEKWEVWYDLAQEVGEELISGNKITPKWVAPYLSNQSSWENHWNRQLVVDLGAELTRVEAELLKTLSRTIDVQVLMPIFSGDQKYKYLMNAYEEIEGFGKVSLFAEKTKMSSTGSSLDHAANCFRFTGPLAEIKFLTLEIRKLLESGVPADAIAVIATDIESYWPMLEVFFKEEGIPYSKEGTYRIQSLPLVHWWLSRLRVASHSYEYPDLETSAFQNSPLSLRFEKFSALFSNILDHEDLARDSSVLKAMTDESIPKEPIDLKYFIGVLTRLWPNEAPVAHFEMVLKELLSVNDSELKLKFIHWLFWLEQIVSKMELHRSSGNREGVQIISLSSADSVVFTHRFFLSLTESSFKGNGSQLVSSPEVEKIFRDTGFQLSSPETSAAQFQLEWLASQTHTNDYFLFPMTNFSGAMESPHPLWMQKSNNEKILITIPFANRLDSIMSQPSVEKLVQATHWTQQLSESRALQMHERILQDCGEQALPPMVLKEMPTLSASQFERYFQCPFKFAAGKLFHLLDEAQVDLDPDQRSLGSIVHKLFERLSFEPRKYDYEKSEICSMLDEISKKFILGDPRLWPPLREKYTQLAFRFLKFEKETAVTRKLTSHRELKFKKSIDEFQWSGSLDRVDEQNDGTVVIYDYKSSDKSFGVKTWIAKNHLQLAFYAWLIKNHHIEELSGKTLTGALYYVYRDFKLRGVHPEEPKEQEALKENIFQIEQKMEILKSALKKGEFAPKPLTLKECERCQWSQLCRAPHLNQ